MDHDKNKDASLDPHEMRDALAAVGKLVFIFNNSNRLFNIGMIVLLCKLVVFHFRLKLIDSYAVLYCNSGTRISESTQSSFVVNSTMHASSLLYIILTGFQLSNRNFNSIMKRYPNEDGTIDMADFLLVSARLTLAFGMHDILL